jgi:hypothetical protein
MPVIKGTSYTFIDFISGESVINGSHDKWAWTEQLVKTIEETDIHLLTDKEGLLPGLIETCCYMGQT